MATAETRFLPADCRPTRRRERLGGPARTKPAAMERRTSTLVARSMFREVRSVGIGNDGRFLCDARLTATRISARTNRKRRSCVDRRTIVEPTSTLPGHAGQVHVLSPMATSRQTSVLKSMLKSPMQMSSGVTPERQPAVSPLTRISEARLLLQMVGGCRLSLNLALATSSAWLRLRRSTN